MGKREPNMEDAPYRVFKSEKQVSDKKKKKKKETYVQPSFFNDGDLDFY